MNLLRTILVGMCLLPVVFTVHAAMPAGGAAVTAVVRAALYTPTASAYAQVVPVQVLTVRAQISGTVTGVHILPGATLPARSRLLRIAGPEAESELHVARANVKSAKAAAALAKKKLWIDRQMPTGFVTRLQLSEAQTSVTQADANLQAARSQLAFILKATQVRLPVAGTVLAVDVADGSHVIAGDALATVQQTSGLWLQATFYGAEAGRIRAGVLGIYHAQGGELGVAVRVQSIIPPLRTDGGVTVGCEAQNARVPWQNGAAGVLTLALGEKQLLPQVPNSALIMDQGRWWVLVAGDHGWQRRAVEIGPTSDGWTFVRQGLRVGERVAAAEAYLLFHEDISRHYAPPD